MDKEKLIHEQAKVISGLLDMLKGFPNDTKMSELMIVRKGKTLRQDSIE